MEPFRGDIWRLAERPWPPREGRLGRTGLAFAGRVSSTVAAELMDTMDSDRWWVWPGRRGGCGGGTQGCESLRERLELDEGTLSDKVERWPRPVTGGVKPLLLLLALLLAALARNPEGSKGEGCRERSLWAAVGVFSWVAVGATFLKVMRHLTSSPAKTVWSSHLMKTRMLVEASGDMMTLLPVGGDR